MAGNLITSLLSLATNLLPSITASAHAPSSSSSNSNIAQNVHARAVEEDLERLMRTLEGIKATLYDAEERKIRDHYVKHWLKELKKVAYDAEDVLSEYRYEVTCLQIEARKASRDSGSQKRKQMEHIVPISVDMVDLLKKIRSRFDEIAKDREALQLRESDGVRRPNTRILRPPTGHMVDEESIFGRAAEIRDIINFLLYAKDKSFSIISIVGKGGLGKTTIAQLVYKNGDISHSFDLFGWVCVSEEFDVRRLIKATIESISSQPKFGVTELSPLQKELAEMVKGKTILLVLDDVWNDNQTLWELFRVPFKVAKIVTILVTTRNKKVAEVMQTMKYFSPTNLPEDSCWQLFQHYAFSGISDTVPKHLVDMGREIVRKCGGLPLAVKSIASLLRHETYEECWREILESDLWESNPSNDIFPALQISYAHLPPYLKPCFLFCSMYPKDHLFKKMNLIELWISHGYIESSGKRTITEIGVEYYEELKQRSFLDDFSSYYSECCKLHDIIHDLARLNSDNEHYSVESYNQPLNTQKRNIPQEVYHLYAGGFSGYVNQILPQNFKGLRTLSMNLVGHSKFEGFILNKFKALRVLELTGNFNKIPDFFRELKHLAYLNITSADFNSLLPLSIGLLYNLRTLILCCYSLEYLPESIGDLANLQFLYIQSHKIRNLPISLYSLSNLQTLSIECDYLLLDVPHDLVIFSAIKKIAGVLRVRNIAWLKDMNALEGTLSIEGLDKMINLVNAQRANLRKKCKLKALHLCWDYDTDYGSLPLWKPDVRLQLKLDACEDGFIGVNDVDFSFLECLQPHPNLKKLLLSCYPSATLPGWMMDPFSLQSIQEILLLYCKKIQSLPFSNLHTLKHVIIEKCFGIHVLQLELLPSQLEKLQISSCHRLELITGLGQLHKLADLKIYFCISMKSLTMDGLQLVESTMRFSDTSHEESLMGQQSISSITLLIIRDCDLLRDLPDGLIPSGRSCYVRVQGCGCPDIKLDIRS